jgi:hypothetical protein
VGYLIDIVTAQTVGLLYAPSMGGPEVNAQNRDNLTAYPQFSQPHPLADEFFLIAWDTAVSGTPVLHPRITALGLSGALLGELALAGRIGIQGPQVWVTDRRPIDDQLAQSVLYEITNTAEHIDLRTWLAYFARNSVQRVAARLTRTGLVEAEITRLLWRKRVRYLATEYAKGAWPAVRLQLMLVKGTDITPTNLTLAGLVEATGLLEIIIADSRERTAASHHLNSLMHHLPPSLRDLTSQLQVSVGDAVLAYRS